MLIKTQVVCAAVILLRRLAAAAESMGEQQGEGAKREATVLETMLASILERLSWPPTSQQRIVEDGGMLALVELVRRRHDPHSPLDMKARTHFDHHACVNLRCCIETHIIHSPPHDSWRRALPPPLPTSRAWWLTACISSRSAPSRPSPSSSSGG